MQQLLAQLKNKGWLGKDAAEKAQEQAGETKIYGWTLGTWNAHHSETDKRGNVITSTSYDGVAFVRHGSVLEGYMEKDSNIADDDPVGFQRLTIRQRQIVQSLAEGQSSKEIATALTISVKTVETHRANIMRRIGCHSVTQLVRYAIRNDIIQA